MSGMLVVAWIYLELLVLEKNLDVGKVHSWPGNMKGELRQILDDSLWFFLDHIW